MPVTMIASGLIQESGNVSYPRVLYYLCPYPVPVPGTWYSETNKVVFQLCMLWM